MKKRILSYFVVTTMIFALVSAFSFTANAAEISATTNKYTYIRMSPYWTAEVIDNLTSGYSITILEREYTYLYIQYTKGGVIKRGYMPKADTDKTGYSWCQHDVYNSGYNSTSSAQTVYYRPGGASCGTIDANEGEVNAKPLLVLHVKDGYAFIQYVTNPTNNGSSHVLFKRGWVPTSVIGYKNSTYPSEINKDRFYYIKNVATNKYLDLASYSAGNVDGGNIHIWDFHGGYNQEWKFLEVQSGSSKYVKIMTNQGTQQNNQNRVIRIAEKTAVVGNSAELYTQSSPSKEQEFVLEKVGNYYQIKARCGSNFMVLGVNPSDSGTGGEVYLRYPYTDTTNSEYNKWEIIPAYLEDTHYVYSSNGKISSDIDNGINAKYNVNHIVDDDYKLGYYNSQKVYYDVLLDEAISSWNKSNTKITLSKDVASKNHIEFSTRINREYSVEYNTYGYVLGTTIKNVGDGSRDIMLYYGSINEYCKDENYNLEEYKAVWKSTLAHELGHTLGLGHPSNYIDYSIMSYGNDIENFTPPHDADMAGVKKNYSSR